MREKSPWNDAHLALKRLWDTRIAPTGMSQEEFGDKYGIGTQGMVSQYLLGTRPLNYDAAAKFARGFKCTIEDICPEMARTIDKDILPFVRRSLRRRKLAVLVALAFVPSLFYSEHSIAGAIQLDRMLGALHIMSNRITAWRRALWRKTRALAQCITLASVVAACASQPNTVSVHWIRIAQADIDKVCADQHGYNAIVIGHYRGCSKWDREAAVCTIWAPDVLEPSQREAMSTIGHEMKHCFDGPWH